jgi:hypothetical protein
MYLNILYDPLRGDLLHAIYVGLDMESSCCSLTLTNVVQILTGKPPFFSTRLDMTILFRVRSGARPERTSYTLTDGMWALLVDCWDQVPQKRPDMGAVVQRLEAM